MRVLVVFLGVIAFLATFALGWIFVRFGVILFTIYPYSVSRMVECLKGSCGHDDEVNRKIVEYNLRFRLVATVMVYLVHIIPVLSVPPWRVIDATCDMAIRVGCLIAWLQIVCISYLLELEQIAIVADLKRIEKVDTQKSGRDEAAVFVDLDGREYRFYLPPGEKDRLEKGGRYVVLGDPNRYWVNSLITRHLRLLKKEV